MEAINKWLQPGTPQTYGLAVALDLLSNKSLPALPHIGVSKLSCLPCWKFLSCLREKKSGFYTRGTSGKTKFPWKFPNQQLIKSTAKDHADTIYEEFYSKMADRYTDCILERPRSGSSMDEEDLQYYEELPFQGMGSGSDEELETGRTT
ncbi:hypothetical protein SI65_02188 [Aspergillus cristatus]|uniref:Uncharacterized protein n=1 Tax=Aspergillus cristatus TaxID=573508 RepID=A0A1E3BK51_ASPCR|nr:hypothetical protein SI65_02188 [Aspergillus cristatus]